MCKDAGALCSDRKGDVFSPLCLPDELKSPETTGKWEKALEDIRTGEEKEEHFMEGIKNMTREIISKIAC